MIFLLKFDLTLNGLLYLSPAGCRIQCIGGKLPVQSGSSGKALNALMLTPPLIQPPRVKLGPLKEIPPMGSERKLPPRLAFGPFHLDVSTGELRKYRTRLRLSGHALQILEILLERPNQ